MNQPRGWWFESGGEHCEPKELMTTTRVLLFYASFFTTTACCSFIDFEHVNYQKKKKKNEKKVDLWVSLVARSLYLSNNPYKSEYVCG